MIVILFPLVLIFLMGNDMAEFGNCFDVVAAL